MVLKYTDDVYNESFISTIGVDFKIHTIKLDDKVIKLQIWDTAGQERFKSITSSYYKGSHCIIFVYDLTDLPSFNNLKNWIGEMKHHTGEKYSYIVGNKLDKINIYDNPRCIDKEIAQEFAKNNNMDYTETSAKTGTNLKKIFDKIAIDLINLNQLANAPKVISLEPNDDFIKRNCNC